jgi:hypothetical protein
MSVKLFHPDATGCSVDGVSYEKGTDGAFDVEDAHAAALMDHGFSTTPPDAMESPSRKTRQKKAEE